MASRGVKLVVKLVRRQIILLAADGQRLWKRQRSTEHSLGLSWRMHKRLSTQAASASLLSYLYDSCEDHTEQTQKAQASCR